MAIFASALGNAAILRKAPSNRNQAQQHREDSLARPT